MKYIIDIDEPEDCGCCPMNYDYIGCQVYKGDKKIDPLKEWVEANLPDGVRPDRCPLNGCEVSELLSIDKRVMDAMKTKVKVRTDGDNFASLEYEGVLVEIEKDGDSPSCPNSWTWSTWLDGKPMDSTCDEESLHESVSDAITSIDETIEQLSVMSEYLKKYDVLCGKLREASDE